MSDFMLEPTVKAELAIKNLAARQGEVLKGERGASALEYIGMVLVAAIIVGAVFTAVNGAGIPGKLTAALAKILP